MHVQCNFVHTSCYESYVGDMRLYTIGCIIHTVVMNIKYLSVSVEMVYVIHTICVVIAEVCLKLLLGTPGVVVSPNNRCLFMSSLNWNVSLVVH